jgi:hypothetical protein
MRNVPLQFTVKNTGRGGELFGVAVNWRFEPDSVQYYGNAVSEWFTPPVVEDLDADTFWLGPIVHPGKVIVTGVGASNTSADTVVLTVTARNWGPPTVVLDESAFNSASLGVPQSASDDLVGGRFHAIPDSLGWDPTTFFTVDSIETGLVPPGGPNEGYHWVTWANFQMRRAYSLNPWIDPPGYTPYHQGYSTTDWVQNQQGPSGTGVVDYRANAVMHEIGPSAITQKSHYERQDFAASDTISCGHLNRAVERLVAGTSGALDFRIGRAKDNAQRAVHYASGHYYVYDFQSQGSPAVAWFPLGTVRTSTLLDVQSVNNDGRIKPDSLFCDISAF